MLYTSFFSSNGDGANANADDNHGQKYYHNLNAETEIDGASGDHTSSIFTLFFTPLICTIGMFY